MRTGRQIAGTAHRYRQIMIPVAERLGSLWSKPRPEQGYGDAAYENVNFKLPPRYCRGIGATARQTRCSACLTARKARRRHAPGRADGAMGYVDQSPDTLDPTRCLGRIWAAPTFWIGKTDEFRAMSALSPSRAATSRRRWATFGRETQPVHLARCSSQAPTSFC